MGTATSADGTAIAFDRRGSGPPLILVGGATQHRAVDQTTDDLADQLAARFEVISYDRRGRGESGDTPPYAVAREIEDVEALIAQAGGEASLFGMSSGGVLALDAAQHGAPVTKVVAYEPPVRADAGGPPIYANYRADLEAILADGRNGDALALFLQLVGMPAEEIEGFRASPGWAPFEAVAPTLAYDAAIMDDLSRGEPIPAGRWDRVSQPALVIDGGDSPEFMRNGAAAVAAALPNARALTLAGQTHSYEPAVLAPALAEFLAD